MFDYKNLALAFCFGLFVNVVFFAGFSYAQIDVELNTSAETDTKTDTTVEQSKTTYECETDKLTGNLRCAFPLNIEKQVSIRISTGATDYEEGDEAIIFTKVSNNGLPIDDAFCDARVFFPNRTEFQSLILTKISGSRGVYSGNLTIPDALGVYIVDVNCLRPVNESSQRLFLRGNNGDNPPSDIFFKNSTGSDVAEITINDLSDSIFCFPDRFSTGFPNDFSSGEFKEIGFLKNITNISISARKEVGVGVIMKIILRFYKETTFGEIHLDSVINETTITSTDARISFADLDINSNFEPDENLEMEICALQNIGSNDLTLSFNSTGVYDGGFIVNSIKINQTLDFVVGGASELNVRDDTIQTAILTRSLEKLSNDNFCVSNTTLQHNITLSVNNRIKNVIETEPCPFGCDLENHRCNPSPFDALVWYVIGGIVGFVVLLIIVLKLIK